MTNPYNPPVQTPTAPQYVQPVMPVGLVPMTAPTVALTIVITLLFGIFGLIPAASGSSKAKALGLPSGKYWAAFWGVFGGWFLLLFIMLAAGGGGS